LFAENIALERSYMPGFFTVNNHNKEHEIRESHVRENLQQLTKLYQNSVIMKSKTHSNETIEDTLFAQGIAPNLIYPVYPTSTERHNKFLEDS
jgi:hypothetical protein